MGARSGMRRAKTAAAKSCNTTARAWIPTPLAGWRKVILEDGAVVTFKGPAGESLESLAEVYEYEVASKYADAGVDGVKVPLSILQQFLNEC